MKMAKRVLWLDNDKAYLGPYVKAMRELGYKVELATSVPEAESLVQSSSEHSKPYDLLILDVMIPTKTALEERMYPPDKTDHGFKAGLLFYERNKEKLKNAGTHVLVLTLRIDRDIYQEFVKAGLPEGCFATKFALRDVPVFTQWIKEAFAGAPTKSHRPGSYRRR
jgi:CheY-like chemotaxis protein